ncbi:MAG: hypothetical protein IKO10_02065 [Lachnospiraceae bacterium]|nr:hypothetical protein [Lachnospiraceae bacterium]
MEQLFLLAVIAALLGVFFLMGLAERRRYQKRLEQELKERYGKRQEKKIPASRMECIPAYFRKHQTDTSIDDITWSDLEMDRLFTAMNLTCSSAGEEVLYHTLRTPLFDKEALEERAGQIAYFREHEEERRKLQLLLAGMGKNDRYSLYDYLDFAEGMKGGESWKYHFLAPVLLIAAVAFLFVQVEFGVLGMVFAIVFNMGWYFKTKGDVQPYIITLKHVVANIRVAKKLQRMQLNVCERQQKELAEALAQMKNFSAGDSGVFSSGMSGGDPLALVGDYVNMLLHTDLIRFYGLYVKLQQHKEQVDVIHGSLGYFEMLIAAGSFEEALENVCKPQFDGVESASEIWHPMIEDPVKNSYRLKGCMLLTGSNASGKSTFLKTIAINQLLSQTLYFACAEEFHTEFHRIYTSMSLRDDLEHQESYFMVEIRAMQRILEAGKQEGAKIACFVDEVLRGTNTVERIAASTEILKYMAQQGYFCAAATHDIELTALLEGPYENYHFSEEIKDGDVLFNYQLQSGKAQTRNAIRLLSVMGYEDGIIERAESLAEAFLKEGVWQK